MKGLTVEDVQFGLISRCMERYWAVGVKRYVYIRGDKTEAVSKIIAWARRHTVDMEAIERAFVRLSKRYANDPTPRNPLTLAYDALYWDLEDDTARIVDVLASSPPATP